MGDVVFAQAEDETPSAVRTWGSQHAALWVALAAVGRGVEVVFVGRTAPESVNMSHQEATAEMTAIKTAIANSELTALEAWSGLNPALQRTRVFNAACAGSRRSTAATAVGRTGRSTRVPADLWRP